jgi:hypothetical protein
MFGLLFFVPLLGMAVGAAMGALAGSMSDVGIDDRFVEEVREKVTPGTSALFVMTSRVVEDRVLEEFRGTRAELISTNLSREQEDRRGGPNHARPARGAVGETVELQVMRAWSDKAGRPGARPVQDVVEGHSQRPRWVVRNLLVQHFARVGGGRIRSPGARRP